MSTQFIKGADLSLLQYLEDHGIEYRHRGEVKDLLQTFQEHGGNYVRLRLFVAPNGNEGQVNTLPYTLRLAGRVKAAGLPLLLDFHYSDGWADPMQQNIPAAWQELSQTELAERVYTYTRETLAAFRREGCLPDMVEVGNEITNGMLWPAAGPLSDTAQWNDTASPQPLSDAKWDMLCDLLKAGIQGVRDNDPLNAVKIMIHIDKGGSKNVSRWFFDNLQARRVEFDVIGLSYYPFWHGTFLDLQENLAFLAQTYQKEIIVVETGYDTGGGEQNALPFPLTPEGQKLFLEELIRIVVSAPGGFGTGVFYWAPEWVNGKQWNGPEWSSQWEARALFDASGSTRPGWQAFQTETV